MLYYLLKPIVLIALKLYFRRRVVKGAEHEPKAGPYIIVANHPGTLMDPLIVGAALKAKLNFLSKATVFNNPVNRWLFKHMGMIPVYRAADDPTQIHKNKDTFIKCYEHLEKKGILLIFPEGVSFAARKLQKIKSGTARIALATEERNGFSLGLKILCVGINYSASHKFQSDVFTYIDKPINVSDYRAAYEKDIVAGTHALTEEIKSKLEKLTIAMEDEEDDALVQKIEQLYKSDVLKELGVTSADKEQDFYVTRKIAEAVNYFREKDPSRVEQLSGNIERYFDMLEKLRLNHYVVRGFQKKRPMWFRWTLNTLYFIFGFPLFLMGMINNYLPFKLPGWITESFTKELSWLGGVSLAIGILTTMLFYTGQTILVQYLFHDPLITIAYLALLPLSGLFAFYYWRKFTNLRGRWHVMAIFSRKANLITDVYRLRDQVMNDIRLARKEFEAALLV